MSVLRRCNGVGLALFAKNRNPLRIGKRQTRSSIMTEAEFKHFVRDRQWRYAKSMPQWPHEYTVRKFEDPAENQALFEAAVLYIRAHGEKRVFAPTRKSSVYLDLDGRQYWTMGAPAGETIIINRAWLDWQARLAAGELPQTGR